MTLACVCVHMYDTCVWVHGWTEGVRTFGDGSVVDERKVDQVLSELDRYGVVVAGLQETKWFGSKIYKVVKSVILSSGWDVPKAGGSRQRGEGVAIVMSGPAVSAWKAGGSQWKTWSSRLVMATLETGRGRVNDYMYYPAMHQLLLPVKRKRTSSLIFSKMLSQPFHQGNVMSCLVTLMHVWGPGQWMTMNGGTKELSPHGYGELNEAGRDLLPFLSTNEATVCNTWFQKKRIYKQTWQHPKSHKWHCIDYVRNNEEETPEEMPGCMR